MGTVIVAVLLLAVIALIVWKMYRDRKAGKSPRCGGDCSHCGGCCSSVKR